MDISRRKFLRFAPASVGAFALGALVLPKAVPAKSWAGHWQDLAETILRCGQKAADPPLMYEPNIFPGGVSYTDFEKIGDQLFSRGA